MKRYRILVAFVSMAMGLLLWACRPEPDSDFKGGDVQVTLFSEPYRNVTVKSPASRDESLLYRVWYFQFQGDDIIEGADGPLIDLITAPQLASTTLSFPINIDSRADKVVYIANTDAAMNLFDVKKLTDLENRTVEWASTDGNLDADEFVMYGVWESGDDPLHVLMERAAVKINFNLRVAPELASRNEGFAISSIQLKKVPAISHPFRNTPSDQVPAEGQAFPALPFDTLNYTVETFTGTCWPDELWMPTDHGVDAEILNTTGKSWTWYMPENARGTGSASDQNLKTAATAPAGQGDYCSYVEIKGYYNANGLVNGVTYRVWLGEDHISDYNLLRNTCYNVTSTIYGQHAIDTRINEKNPLNYWDYTDNGTAWMMVAAGNTSQGDRGECPEGWMFPTKQEGMLTWVYKNADLIEASSYWWLEIDQESSVESWSIDMYSGQVSAETESRKATRCVKVN